MVCSRGDEPYTSTNSMKLGIITAFIAVTSLIAPAYAFDNGPRVVGCEFRSSAAENLNADNCLIPSSGTQMGQSWLIVRPGNSKLYYRFEDNHGAARNQAEKWQRAKIQAGSEHNSPINWQGSFTYKHGQCRPGGASADIYELGNGAKICIYFRN